jgi:hypothetical protein
MKSQEPANLLELIRECREVLASGRIADGAQMDGLAEAELAELMGPEAALGGRSGPDHFMELLACDSFSISRLRGYRGDGRFSSERIEPVIVATSGNQASGSPIQACSLIIPCYPGWGGNNLPRIAR